MHVPDGFFDTPTSVATGAVAVVAIGLSLRGARRELDDKTAPMTGVVAAFIFAVQMLNFPVAAGTSGHLLGGTLAALLVGPWTAVLVMTVVLGVQALFFADGGLTALGTNITLMGVLTVVIGWWVTKSVLGLLPKKPGSVAPAAFVAAVLSVPASALGFVALFAVGGAAPVPLGTLAGAMAGVHVAIGVGEAVITAATIGAVLAVRPDLVYAARPLLAARELVIKSSPSSPQTPSDNVPEKEATA